MRNEWEKRRKKGFTLIELIVVMAVMAILALLAAPKFLGQTKEAQFTKHITNAKVVEDASERYYIDHGQWPRLTDDAYTSAEIEAFADTIYAITGEEVTLEPNGNYYDVDYEALAVYAKIPDKSDRNNYILRNPVGEVYYLEGLNNEGKTRVDYGVPLEDGEKEPEKEEIIPENPDVKVGKGEVVSIMAYGEGDVVFKGLSPAAFDGDAKTSYQGNNLGAIVSWEGDLAHREIEIASANTSGVTSLEIRFKNASGDVLKMVDSGYDYRIIGGSKTSIASVAKVVVPAGATQLEFYESLGFYIYDITITN